MPSVGHPLGVFWGAEGWVTLWLVQIYVHDGKLNHSTKKNYSVSGDKIKCLIILEPNDILQ